MSKIVKCEVYASIVTVTATGDRARYKVPLRIGDLSEAEDAEDLQRWLVSRGSRQADILETRRMKARGVVTNADKRKVEAESIWGTTEMDFPEDSDDERF